MNAQTIRILPALLLLFGLIACIDYGGETESDTSDDNAGIGGTGSPVSPAKISGRGMGVITGFGSIIINGDRVFEVTDDTTFSIDGQALNEAEFVQQGIGLVTRLDIGADISDDFSSGSALVIASDNVLKGPVTALAPLTVLNQPVVITSDTVLQNIPGDTIANLRLNDIVEVSGFINKQNVVDATRLERKTSALPEWELNGYISDLVANMSFKIGSQTVVINGTPLERCGPGLSNGAFVEIKAAPDSDLTALSTVTKIECKTQGLGIPENAVTMQLPAGMEGVVTAFTSIYEFEINGQRIAASGGTKFEGGNANDIALGLRLEAEGTLHTDTGILSADVIRFRQGRVRIAAPVTPSDITVGESLNIIGIHVVATSATRDDHHVISNGLSSARQIEVYGFADSQGLMFASEIRNIGSPQPQNVRLRGPADNIANPLFKIAGVTINTDTAESLEDDSGNHVAQEDFFALISTGTFIEVEHGSYTAGANSINNADIEIEHGISYEHWQWPPPWWGGGWGGGSGGWGSNGGGGWGGSNGGGSNGGWGGSGGSNGGGGWGGGGGGGDDD
jgi:hypothetical protein